MMTVALGCTDFLLRDPMLSEVRRVDAREIERAAERSAIVVRQLLAFSRQAAYAPRTLVLDTLVREIGPILGRLAGGLQLTTTLDCPDLVRVDPHQVEQIVTNLVLNARDATRSGDTIELRTGVAALGESKEGVGGVPIRPDDTGCLRWSTRARAWTRPRSGES